MESAGSVTSKRDSVPGTVVSQSERERIRTMLGDEIADNWEYYQEQADKYNADMDEWYEANRERLEAEDREREAIAAQAQARLEEAMKGVYSKRPDMSGLGNHVIDVCELGETLCIGEGRLIANPHFVMANDPAVLAVILMHEWLHVVKKHGERGAAFRNKFTKDGDRRTCDTVWNAGSDLEVNSKLLPELVSVGIQHESLVPGYGDYQDWPAGLTAEEYADRIMACPERMAYMREIGKHRLTHLLSDE